MSENNETETVPQTGSETAETESTRKLSYEELEAEIKKVRAEAAERRIALRDMKNKADEWDKYQESQKTELQKLQEALAERDKKLAGFELESTKRSVIHEFGLDNEDADLLTGSDEATIRKQAERLSARVGKKADEKPRPADLLAGNRGTPVGTNSNTSNVDDLIRKLAGR